MDTINAPAKKNVLFVDDEPNILAGIQRALRSIRHDFNFFFAENGVEALKMMDQQSIAIIVSDMRMPGMDGAQLLTEVQQRHPQTIRIMLTGHAEEEAILRTVNVVHQLLAKPCEPNTLKQTLQRSSTLHDLITDEVLKGIVSGLGSLPSLPAIYSKLVRTLKDPDSALDDVATIIEQDVAMTAKLMQLVNSSFFGIFQKIDNTGRAVKLLGLDTIKDLVLGMQVFDSITILSTDLRPENLWHHSILVAQASKQIALKADADTEMINNCYIAGMLHDIGRLLLASKMDERYAETVSLAKSTNKTLTEAEREVFQVTHAELGAYLIGLWGFHVDIFEALAFHNNLDAYTKNTFSAAIAVHIADYCYYQQYPDNCIGSPPVLNLDFINGLQPEAELELWLRAAQESMAKSNS